MNAEHVVEVALGHHHHELVAGEAGRVNEHVEAARALRFEERGDRRRVGHVAARGGEPGRFGRASGGFVVCPGGDHLVAGSDERARDGEAEAAGAAGDEGAALC